MIRICNSLAVEGYDVVLVGRERQKSIPLIERKFEQKRLSCFFEKGKLFYVEFNFRLFIYMLFKKMDGICAIDLDTIIPCFWISSIKKIPRIYDAHELFCEMKEIAERPRIYKIWKWIERKTVPHFKYGYTVNGLIAEEFNKMYGLNYKVIRSISELKPNDHDRLPSDEKFILYQGALNEGRCFEALIPAMKQVRAKLIICGEGNFSTQARKLVEEDELMGKIIFKGMLPPDELKTYNSRAYLGITLFESNSRSNYYSLANRFFDYIHAGIPQLCSDYPLYQELNNLYNIGVLIKDPTPDNIAKMLNDLLSDETKWNMLHENCLKARELLCWQNEKVILIAFYREIFG